MPGPSLIEHFAALDDPRQSWKVLFPLPEVLLLVLCGTLAGAEDFVEIRRWGQMHQEFLRRLLPYKAGVPSHDTLNDVINAIDGALFAECFTAWVEGLRDPAPASAAPEIVAIDGKTSRRTHDHRALKDNQATLHDEVRRYLDDPGATIHSRFETTDGDHGRIEVRRHWVSHDVDWLITSRRFPGEPRFAGLRAIAMVEAEVERNGSISLERRCYLHAARRQAVRLRRALPLARRKPSPLGAGRRVPRGSQPPAIRSRPAKHGHRPAHGHEPPARTER